MNGYTVSIVEWHTGCFAAHIFSTQQDCHVYEVEGDSPTDVLSKALIWIEGTKEKE